MSSKKPTFSFSKMILDVLLESEQHKLPVREICKKLSEKHPGFFSMKEKNWKASVRCCLTNKDQFVKDNANMKGSCWRLSDDILNKLRTPGYDSFDKENISSDSWNAGKYVKIAPKPHFNNENSFDGTNSSPCWSSTPLKTLNLDTNRLCFSEDKNVLRKRLATEFADDASIPTRKPREDSDVSWSIGLPRRKITLTRHSLPKAKTQSKVFGKFESRETYRVQINNDSSVTSGSAFKSFDELSFNSSDNASFNIESKSSGPQNVLPTTFREHPGFPFTKIKEGPSNEELRHYRPLADIGDQETYNQSNISDDNVKINIKEDSKRSNLRTTDDVVDFFSDASKSVQSNEDTELNTNFRSTLSSDLVDVVSDSAWTKSSSDGLVQKGCNIDFGSTRSSDVVYDVLNVGKTNDNFNIFVDRGCNTDFQSTQSSFLTDVNSGSQITNSNYDVFVQKESSTDSRSQTNDVVEVILDSAKTIDNPEVLIQEVSNTFVNTIQSCDSEDIISVPPGTNNEGGVLVQNASNTDFLSTKSSDFANSNSDNEWIEEVLFALRNDSQCSFDEGPSVSTYDFSSLETFEVSDT